MASPQSFDGVAQDSPQVGPARGSEMRKDLLSKLRAPPLTHSWDFWHDRQGRIKTPSGQDGEDVEEPASQIPNYEDRLVHLTKISNVRDFWSMFNNFSIPSLPLRDSIHLFHRGIKPIWEDPRNTRGGSWTFRVPKDKGSEFWKEICMMAIGEQLQQAVASNRMTFVDDICGVSLSVRFTSILVQIWNRDADHKDGIDKIIQTVMENLPEDLKPKENAYYYKKHSDHSNFSSSKADASYNDPKAGTSINPSMTQQSGRETYLPAREVGQNLNVRTESHAAEIRQQISAPGIVPMGVDSDGHKGVRSDEENAREIDETLGAMKQAMDRVGEGH